MKFILAGAERIGFGLSASLDSDTVQIVYKKKTSRRRRIENAFTAGP
jgi:hypothetical protein